MKKTKTLPKDEDLRNAGKALVRSAKKALQIAIQTKTPCYIYKDGKIIDIAKQERKKASMTLSEKKAAYKK